MKSSAESRKRSTQVVNVGAETAAKEGYITPLRRPAPFSLLLNITALVRFSQKQKVLHCGCFCAPSPNEVQRLLCAVYRLCPH
jgi:hypothetical protein